MTFPEIDSVPLDGPLRLNRDCYCRDVNRETIVREIVDQNILPNMNQLLTDRLHYFANTSIFLSSKNVSAMTDQIEAIEDVIKLPAYRELVGSRSPRLKSHIHESPTKGVFMGYDFHITTDGPKLIEINSNAGGAFIVNMIEQATDTSVPGFAAKILTMFQNEWSLCGRPSTFKTLAIVDENPVNQYHFPDMCLAQAIFESQGVKVVITDPKDLRLVHGHLYHGELQIDLVYNRLTDFDLSNPANEVIWRAYSEDLAVVTPAPHHHALFADKRNLILLSDQEQLEAFGANLSQLEILNSIPQTTAVSKRNADDMWASRRSLFFKPQAGFGSRGAFRGAKLTKKTWAEILKGDYIAQDRILPPSRAVTVDGEQRSLKFDVRVYTYDGKPLLLAARIYQGQTTNLRTAGGGLAAVVSIPENCFSN